MLPFGFRKEQERAVSVIFFSDVISELEKVQLEAGTVMLGPLALFAILFADDLVILARTIMDLQ